MRNLCRFVCDTLQRRFLGRDSNWFNYHQALSANAREAMRRMSLHDNSEVSDVGAGLKFLGNLLFQILIENHCRVCGIEIFYIVVQSISTFQLSWFKMRHFCAALVLLFIQSKDHRSWLLINLRTDMTIVKFHSTSQKITKIQIWRLFKFKIRQKITKQIFQF